MKYCVRYCTNRYVGEIWSRNGKPCGEGHLCAKNERGIRLWDTKTAAEEWLRRRCARYAFEFGDYIIEGLP